MKFNISKIKKLGFNISLFYILLFAVFLRLYFFVGPNMNDDIDYIFSASEVSKGRFYPIYGGSINAIRTMITLPTALSFFFFGVSELTAALYPLFCSILTIIVTYLLAKMLFNKEVGLLSALLLSLFPLDIAFSTQIVPTTPITLFLFSSLLFLLYAEKLKSSKSRKNKKYNIFYFLSGILLGLGYLTNIMIFVLMFIFVVYFFWKRKFNSGYFLVAAGLILIILIEFAFMFIQTGDPFHRPNVIHATEVMIGTNTALDYYPRVILNTRDANYTTHEGNVGLYFYMFLLSGLFLLFKGQKESIFLIISFILIMGYFQYGIMTVGFKPIAKWVRYLIVFGPIFSLVTANFIYEFFKKSRPAMFIIVFIIFVTSIPFIIGTTTEYREWTEAFRTEYSILNSLPEKTIYTDMGSGGFLQFYFGYNRDIINLEGSKLEDIKDCYVILDGSHGIVYYQPMRNRLPDFAINPPQQWELIKSFEASDVNPKIYYVP